jgi:NADH-quinone oxidoreductase subunit J
MMIPRSETFPPRKRKITLFLSIFLAAVLAVEIFISLWPAWRGEKAAGPSGLGSTSALGRTLFRDFLYPFEITSLLIMAALVGSIVLSKKRGKE